MYKYCNETIKVKTISPVTLIQAKDQCSVDYDFVDDDRLLLSKIDQAISYTEDRTGIDIVLTENTKEYFEFSSNFLRIEETPLKELKTITKIVDETNSTLVIDTDYVVQRTRTGFNIRFTENQNADKLTLIFNTGFNFDDIPFSLESAILIKVNDLYDMERTSYTVGANFRKIDAYDSLISGYIVNRW